MDLKKRIQDAMTHMETISASVRNSGEAVDLMRDGHALFLKDEDSDDYYVYSIDHDSVIRTCLKRTTSKGEDPIYSDLCMDTENATTSFNSFSAHIREADIVAIDKGSIVFNELFPKK